MQAECTSEGWNVDRTPEENEALLAILRWAAKSAHLPVASRFQDASARLDTRENPALLTPTNLYYLRVAIDGARRSSPGKIRDTAQPFRDDLPSLRELLS